MNTTKLSKGVDVPYAKLGMNLLSCIYDLLGCFIEEDIADFSEEELEKKLKEYLLSKAKVIESEFHLNIQRLLKIVINNYKNVLEDSKSSQGFCIPSPLAILYQFLTVPNEAQSAAYVILFCRSLLYEEFRVFPKFSSIPNDYTIFDFSRISSCLETFFSYTKYYKNISEKNNDKVQSMLAHYLALKGIFYLRFNTKKDIYDYLQLKKISSNNIEFHKFTYYKDLPDVSILMNELSGIPIPIGGIDTIFQGGLSTNSKSNLVMRVNGQAGSGKTSFALALAAAMSPFGTYSYYISLEEEKEDLVNRLCSLIPNYLTKLTIYNDDINSWFDVDKIDLYDYYPGEKKMNYIIDYLNEIYKKIKQEEYNGDFLPSVCPMIIVIDSIRPFRTADLEKFITKCRQFEALIIIISSPNEEQSHNDIDYMVDVVINLKHEGVDGLKVKPTRIMQLLKTRHQISRHGAHVFHFSSKYGINISPQLPSQIDKKETVSKPIPSSSHYINFFNEYNNNPPENPDSPYLPIWDKSQVVLYGYGSTGKAGLALTILLYPYRKKQQKESSQNDPEIFKKRNVLIVSLLYPEEYYTELENRIKMIYSNINENAKIDCLCFYSGYLSPEDFINKIINKLDTAILEGEPFTGILLDGLHNATLQFPKLQESDMVWSTLYSLLAKYRLTIITTFSNFIVNGENPKEVLLEDGREVLDIVIQAADYSFFIQKPQQKEISESNLFRKIKRGQYLVTLKSAIRHEMNYDKTEVFFWEREKLLLKEVRSLSTNFTQHSLFS